MITLIQKLLSKEKEQEDRLKNKSVPLSYGQMVQT